MILHIAVKLTKAHKGAIYPSLKMFYKKKFIAFSMIYVLKTL